MLKKEVRVFRYLESRDSPTRNSRLDLFSERGPSCGGREAMTLNLCGWVDGLRFLVECVRRNSTLATGVNHAVDYQNAYSAVPG